MDRKTAFILSLGKYGGYLAVFWVTVSNAGLSLFGPLLPLFLVFSLDNIRIYYLTARRPELIIPSLYAQITFAFIFSFIESTPVGSILLVILIAESLLAYHRPHGDNIFLMSIVGFPAVSATSLIWRSAFSWEAMATVLINCLFLFFAYGVTYMARRQQEEKERAEDALEQLDRSRADLEKAYMKLVEMSKEQERLAAAQERTRLARELHDTLAHSLTAIVVSLEAGKKLFARDPGRALAEIEKSQEQARRGLEEVRVTVKTLRSGEPEEVDFRGALNSLARDYSGSGINITFSLDNHLVMQPVEEAAFFRIIQEGITNSVRHGKANNIRVRIKGNHAGQRIIVEDDGVGCENLSEGYGLRGIRERASNLGGKAYFWNRPDEGFMVQVDFGSYINE